MPNLMWRRVRTAQRQHFQATPQAHPYRHMRKSVQKPRRSATEPVDAWRLCVDIQTGRNRLAILLNNGVVQIFDGFCSLRLSARVVHTIQAPNTFSPILITASGGAWEGTHTGAREGQRQTSEVEPTVSFTGTLSTNTRASAPCRRVYLCRLRFCVIGGRSISFERLLHV